MTTVSSTSTSTAASTGYSALSSSSSGTGIDYSALIEAKVNARLSKADRIDTKITANEAKITAYTDLQDKLQAVNDALDGLRNRSTSTGASSNLFGQRTAYVGDDDVFSATVDDDTEVGTYSVVVQQLATKHKIAADSASSKTDALGYSGSFTLQAADGSAVTISMESDDSLTDLRDAINANKSTSGVTASIVQVSDSSYQLILTSNNTGEAISLTDGGDGVLSSLGLTDSDGAIKNEMVAVQDAIVEVDGVTITRSSNTIDDAIEGVTLNLYSASPDTAISMEVSTDLSAIKSAISSFVDAYNEYRDFVVTQQSTTSDGTASSDATLFSDSLLRQIVRSVNSALNTSITTDDGTVLSMASLGITFNSSNELELDEDTLNSILSTDIDSVKQLLGLNMTSSSSQMSLLRYTSSASALSFSLDIVRGDDGTLTSASVNGDSSLFTVSGNRIIGASGTAYEGIVLVYSGNSGSVDIDFSQGLADKLFGVIDDASATYDSDLATAIDDLETRDTDLESKSNDIKTKAETYRTTLTAYYAKLEAAAEQAALLLKQLTYSDSSSSDS
ncbi:flagellar hook-associated protein 2 [Azospirillum lipoferum]|uniref:Flagellar hook-associated protein 2 n=1 Tax=Azospirillum lipoferum TaxID=193 RepID=A0A5A9GMJ1_AZOLI|nr:MULTISPECIES: flagellar filament capping protein FliD [Azospirillum]KAA0594509.1 flagellar filament capping protein FliD [Azospirillum lipoferum]MCP1613263.1 flagellar hook-associated protein 2 [Azospirillum lipoferum]MDW5531462.1 flagellar filament capping protein FliD [Azospirillum sp. NL1]